MSDLTDVSAWICYLTIALVGAIVSFQHISSKSGGVRLWLHPSLWAVFCIYVAVPLTLFWILDATGELKDTSLILAIVNGLLFKSILAGTNDQFTAPSALSGIWISLEGVINSIVAKGADKEHRYKAWKRRALQRAIIDTKDKSKIRNLYRLATRLGVQLSQNVQADFDRSDKEIGVSRRELVDLSDEVYFRTVKKHKSEFLVAQVFYEEKLLTWRQKNITCKFDWPWVIKYLFVVGAITAAGMISIDFVKKTTFYPELNYYVWRVGKTNSSDKDLHRSMRSVVSIFDEESYQDKYKQYLLDQLLNKLYRVDISAVRAKKISQVIRESRGNIPNLALLKNNLSSILRSDRIEIRVIVQEILTFLNGEYNWGADDKLLSADLSKQLKDKEIEDLITGWQAL
jgi:hypothetical protein